jgi:outer membrane protein
MKASNYLGTLLLSSSSLLAAAQTPAPQVVTLPQAVALAVQHNSALRLSDDRVTLAEARLRQAKDRALPTLGAQVQVSRLSILSPFALTPEGASEPAFGLPPSSFWATVGTVGGEKEIFTGFAEKSAEKSAELLVEASKLDAEKDRLDVEHNVAAAYYNVFKLVKTRQILEDNLRLLARKEHDVQNLLREGVLTSNDLLRIQLQKSNLALSRVDLDNAQSTALYNLATLLGSREPVAIDTVLALGSRIPADLATLQQQAETTRLELKSTTLRHEVAETGLQQVKSAFLPRVKASASYIYLNPNANVFPENKSYLQALNLGVSASYGISPLYASRGRMQEAKVNILQTEHQLAVQQDQIRTEVFSQYNAYRSALEKTGVAEQALAQATRSYQLTDSKFRNGLLLSSDLLESQNLRLQSQLNLLTAQVDAQLAYYRLLKVTGQPIR